MESVPSFRLMNFSRVIDNQICYHSKEVYNVYEVCVTGCHGYPFGSFISFTPLPSNCCTPPQMFHTRYSLFKQIYSHRASKAIEFMITDAFIEAGTVCVCVHSCWSPSS